MLVMKQYYHWCSRGLKHDLLFSGRQEFIAGMNRIGTCYLHESRKGAQIKIVAFCLLNNHFHFVLQGTEEETSEFMSYYRLQTCRWIRKHRGERLHETIEIGHWPASTAEKLREKVVYTLRQTLEAGLRITPQGYPWCSARLMFNDNSCLLDAAGSVSELSGRKASRLFHTNASVPADWKVLSDGMIWPGAYTDVLLAEGFFSGVKDFMFCMNNGNIDRAVNNDMMLEKPSIPDAEIKDKAEALAKGLFGRGRLSECPAGERLAIARYLRKELHCGHKQLARIVRMQEDDLRKMI